MSHLQPLRFLKSWNIITGGGWPQLIVKSKEVIQHVPDIKNCTQLSSILCIMEDLMQNYDVNMDVYAARKQPKTFHFTLSIRFHCYKMAPFTFEAP